MKIGNLNSKRIKMLVFRNFNFCKFVNALLKKCTLKTILHYFIIEHFKRTSIKNVKFKIKRLFPEWIVLLLHHTCSGKSNTAFFRKATSPANRATRKKRSCSHTMGNLRRTLCWLPYLYAELMMWALPSG